MDRHKDPEFEYEIAIPVVETWVYRVKASTVAEAKERIQQGHSSVRQIHSMSGKNAYVAIFDLKSGLWISL